MQSDINYIEKWCKTNRLNLNVGKCNVVSYSRKKYPILFNYKVDNTLLQRVQTIKDLGVTFDEKLSFNNHIENIVSSALKQLGFIIRTTSCLSNSDVLRTLFLHS